MSWRNKLENFIWWKDPEGKFIVDLNYLSQIAQWIPNLIPRKESPQLFPQKRLTCWRKFLAEKNENERRKKFIEFLEIIVEQVLEEGYSSFIWPTFIKEPNLLFENEKLPEEKGIWKILYLIYSSIKIGDSLINLDSVSDEGRKWLWQTLVTQRVLLGRTDLGPIRDYLKISLKYSEKFFNSFALLNFWIKKVAEDLEEGEEEWEKAIQKFFTKVGWTDQTSLIIFSRPRGGKGACFFFPKLSQIVIKWVDPGNETLKFLNSLKKVKADQKVLEMIGKEREKLLFYLFEYNTINGEILAKLCSLKSKYGLQKRGRIYGFSYAKQFFTRLSRSIR